MGVIREVAVEQAVEKVLALIDAEIAFWQEKLKKEQEKILVIDDDRFRGAIVALRRLKGKIPKEVL